MNYLTNGTEMVPPHNTHTYPPKCLKSQVSKNDISSSGKKFRLSDIMRHFKLTESECWSIMHLVCVELQRNVAIYIETGVQALDMAEYVVVTKSSIVLHPHGDISLDSSRRKQDVSHLVPGSLKPLLEFSINDWQKLGLYSLVKSIIPCIDGDNISTEMVMFFRSVLNQNLDCVPRLSDIILYLERKSKPAAAQAKLVASLCAKMEAIQCQNKSTVSENGHNIQRSSRPQRPDVCRLPVTVSCPVLLPAPPTKCLSNNAESMESKEAISNLLNNNDVFSLLDLPGLKLKTRRTNIELSKTCNKPQVYIPGFIQRSHQPAVECILPNQTQPASCAGQVVRLVLLTGHKLEVRLDRSKNTRVRDLLELCVDRMVKDNGNTCEAVTNLFGLFSNVDSEYFYLNPDSLLTTYIQNGVLTLFIRFVDLPEYHDLTNSNLQHLLYLQLRQDFLAGPGHKLEDATILQLSLLAAQAETSHMENVRLDPAHFMPTNTSPDVRIQFQKKKGLKLTADRMDAQALFCGLFINSPDFFSYR